MSYTVTRKLADLVPYTPVQGDNLIHLDANESYFTLTPEIREEVAAAVRSVPFNRYPDARCSGPCQAFAELYGLEMKYISAFNGSDELLFLLANTFFSRGEKVMTISPDFSMYRFYLEMAELVPVELVKGDDFSFPVEQMIETVRKEQIRGVIFSNPCNPTGRGLELDEIRRIVTACPDCLILLDEAYMDFWNQSILPEVPQYDNLIVLRTCSKAIGLAGIRLGFAVANEKLTNYLLAAKSPYNVNTLTQAAASVILRKKEYLDNCRRALIASRAQLAEGLSKLAETAPALKKIYPSSTNFVFLETENNRAVYEALLERGISIRYMKQYLRITAGSPDENRAVLAALEQVL